ncbi:MAG: ATP-binding cassette domain-containing protein [Gemmatimonadales bacterium]
MARAVLEVRDLWVGEGPDAPVQAVSFSVGTGRLLIVRGGAGSGKSRLLGCVGLDQQPTRGAVLLRGEDLTSALPERRRAARAGGWIELVHPPVHGCDGTPPVARRTIGIVAPRAATVPMAGMRQRIQLAKALGNRAEVLLLDEPLAGVEPAVARRILELLHRLRTEVGTAVVLATRGHEQSVALADEVLTLERGVPTDAPGRRRLLPVGQGRRFPGPFKDRRPRRSA